ncbi:MAG TPA: rhodanese-like domain-containing protein [Anaerolineales bacterium]|nr:rhodanese-like domain-containing protein [Anaerolineales bacterium]
MRRFLFALTLIAALLVACGGSQATQTGDKPGRPITVSGGEYRDISVPELKTMLDNKDFTFVNVHIPFEGDIPNTDLSIPFDEISQHLDQLPADKDAKIVLYCRSDRMSNIAAEELVRQGYTNIYNLDGGFVAWEQQGFPIEGR